MKAIVTLTGPSCAGKSTLESQLKERGFRSVISATTRQPRSGEVDGESYYFMTNDEFDKHLAAGNFIENIQFGPNRYGVLASECERIFQDGAPLVVVVEPEGRRQITEYAKKNGWALMKVFVDGSPEVIAGRFLARLTNDIANTEDVDHMKKVMQSAAGRLALMMSQEMSWRAEAYSSPYPDNVYDLIIPEFSPDTQDNIVDQIDSAISYWEADEHEKATA
jgi:guanylate kinase